MFFTTCSAGALIVTGFAGAVLRLFIIFNSNWDKDEPQTLRYAITPNCSKGADGGQVQTTEYLYYASFAVALCEGPITGIGRIWADGKPLDMTGITWRWYPGHPRKPNAAAAAR